MFAADLVAARVAEGGGGCDTSVSPQGQTGTQLFISRVYFEQIASKCASRPSHYEAVINVQQANYISTEIVICTVQVQQRFPSRYADHYAIYYLFPLEN